MKEALITAMAVGELMLRVIAVLLFAGAAMTYAEAQRYDLIGMGTKGVAVFDRVAGDVVIRPTPIIQPSDPTE